MRFLGGQVVPVEEHGAVVERWQERWRLNAMGPFMIERRSDGRFLGRSGIVVWDSRRWTNTTVADGGRYAQPELGWAIVQAEWGNGYATEAARAVRDWVREERRVARLISLIAPENLASQRVAERLGALPGAAVKLYDSWDSVVWEHPGA